MKGIKFLTLLVLVLSLLCTLGVRTAQAQQASLNDVWFALKAKGSGTEFDGTSLVKDSFAVDLFMLLEDAAQNDCAGYDYGFSLIGQSDSTFEVLTTGVFSTCGDNEKIIFSKISIDDGSERVYVEYLGTLKIKTDKQGFLKSAKLTSKACAFDVNQDDFAIVELVGKKCGIKGKTIDEAKLPFDPGALGL